MAEEGKGNVVRSEWVESMVDSGVDGVGDGLHGRSRLLSLGPCRQRLIRMGGVDHCLS